MIHAKTFLVVLTSIGVVSDAIATAVNPLAPAQGFNAFIAGDTRLRQGDIHAGVAVGGDLRFGSGFSVANNQTGSFVAPGDSRATSLLVGGRINFQNSGGEMRVLNNGHVKVGDTTGTHIHLKDQNNASINTRLNGHTNPEAHPRVALTTPQSVASIVADTGIDFGGAFALMAEYSDQMAGLTPTLEITSLPGDNKISYTPHVGELNVINVSGSVLNSISELNFTTKPTANSPVIFNIGVGNGDFTFNSLKLPGLSDPDAAHILYNFFDATGTITFKNAKDQLLGTVFAPTAGFVKDASQNIVGQLVATSYDHKSGELHHSPFMPVIPPGIAFVPPPGSTPVPEASTVAFGAAMTGAVALGAWRGRRRAAKAA